MCQGSQCVLFRMSYKSTSRDPIFIAWTSHHLMIEWVREITSLDSKFPDQTEDQIRTDLRSDTLAERNRSHSSRSLFAERRRCRCCWKKPSSYLYVDTSFLKNTGHVIGDVIICKRPHFDCFCLCSTRILRKKLISLTKKV